MAHEAPITTDGRIVEALAPRRFRVELPNGKIIHAHLAGSIVEDLELSPGDVVPLELSPFDFSKARIAAGTITPQPNP